MELLKLKLTTLKISLPRRKKKPFSERARKGAKKAAANSSKTKKKTG